MIVLAVGAAWFLSSAVLSTWANTTFLLTFEDPYFHTFIRFLGSSLIGLLSCVALSGTKVGALPRLIGDVAFPAVLLCIANCSNSVALASAGVTLTYVVKACIPVFTVIICRFVYDQRFSTLIYISLIPICAGGAVATGTDLDFKLGGFAAALSSALSQTMMNISIKKVRASTGYSGPTAFLGMAIVSTFLTVPLLVFSAMFILPEQRSSVEIVRESLSQLSNGDRWPIILMVVAALAYHIEYALNFAFVSYVSAVAFSVSDIARRIAIIVTGAFLFNKQLNPMNWLGISVALSGVLWYSYLENQASKISGRNAEPKPKPKPRKQTKAE